MWSRCAHCLVMKKNSGSSASSGGVGGHRLRRPRRPPRRRAWRPAHTLPCSRLSRCRSACRAAAAGPGGTVPRARRSSTRYRCVAVAMLRPSSGGPAESRVFRGAGRSGQVRIGEHGFEQGRGPALVPQGVQRSGGVLPRYRPEPGDGSDLQPLDEQRMTGGAQQRPQRLAGALVDRVQRDVDEPDAVVVGGVRSRLGLGDQAGIVRGPEEEVDHSRRQVVAVTAGGEPISLQTPQRGADQLAVRPAVVP